jgi:hypothetical protein
LREPDSLADLRTRSMARLAGACGRFAQVAIAAGVLTKWRGEATAPDP